MLLLKTATNLITDQSMWSGKRRAEDWDGLEWCLKICISDKLPGDADAVGPLAVL